VSGDFRWEDNLSERSGGKTNWGGNMSCKADAIANIDRFINLTDTQKLIYNECMEVADLLIRKNKTYGNSFANPANIFCKLPAEDQINVRIDDKLNRIAKGEDLGAVPEDTELDLVGYLVLKRVLRKLAVVK